MLNILDPYLQQSGPQAFSEVDELMKEIREAVVAGSPLGPVIKKIIGGFGFDGFLYAMSTSSLPNRDGQCYVWTTLPKEWVVAYDKNAYIEVDPRVTSCWNRSTPLIWDSATFRTTKNVCAFLDHAEQYGIRSGLVVSFRDTFGGRFGVMYNSGVSPLTPERTAEIEAATGRLMLFSARFHDWFFSNVVKRGAAPGHRGVPLSPRERECLKMAAHGMTSADIGFKLGITERTVNFHFSHVTSKLDVLNRKEAIAKALTLGIIQTNY